VRPITGRIDVLGSIGLTTAGATESAPIGSGRLRKTLSVLTARANVVVSSDTLADVLWGADQPANPEASLHTVMSRLRRLLGGVGLADRLQTRPPGYLLRLSTPDCDAMTFLAMVDRAEAALVADPAAAAGELDRALALWRGPAYAEFSAEDVLSAEVARLDERRSVAVEHRIDAALAMGEPDRAVVLADAEIVRSPLRERVRSQRMLALYRCGRQPDALAAFREYRVLLDAELGLTPSVELTELHERILRQDPTLDRPAGPAVTGAGVSGAAGLGAAGPRGAGPGAVPVHRTTGNLPTHRPTLIGRESELARLTALITRHRLVVVTGPGGVGKTQLALAAAAESDARHPDGSWFIELAPFTDRTAIVEGLCTQFGITAVAGRTPEQRLLEYLAPQRALLVLDNCEHVTDVIAPLCQAILTGCGSVTMLATSQVPLNLTTEVRFPLATLPVAGSASAPAVRLFLDRLATRTAQPAAEPPDVEAVADLCRRLDGLPLAIELAAARMRVLTPREMVERLPDRLRLLRNDDRLAADRHRTLDDVVAWSYRLLEPAERDLFDRLAVFRGDFTVVDAVAVAQRPESEVLDLLATLVDRSMLQARSGRAGTVFTLLETLRAYGTDRLRDRQLQARVHASHAHRLLQVVQEGAAALSGPDPGPWVREISDRFDDLRSAIGWALDSDMRLALHLVTGLADWAELQLTAELVGWARRAADVTLSARPVDPLVHDLAVVALSMAAAGERFGGDLSSARRLAEQALAAVPDDKNVIRRFPLYVLSEIDLYTGRLTASTRTADEVRRLAQRAGDVLRDRWCVMHQALAAAYGGQHARAAEIAEALHAETGLPALIRAWARYSLGEVLMAGDPQRALVLLDRAVAEARRCEDRFLLGVALLSQASVLVRQGDSAQALPLLREVIEHWHRQGNRTHQWTTFRVITELAADLGNDESAAVLLGAQRHGTRAGDLFGDDERRLDRLATGLAQRLGEHRLRTLMLRGGELTAQELLGVVRATLVESLPGHFEAAPAEQRINGGDDAAG
jgi:predicted ATPase/DNA-binding SARP family transcriptional activator